MDKTADVQCWLYDVSELCQSELFWAALRQLPWEGRKAEAKRFRFAKDRCLCLGAGLLAAHALGEAGVRDLSLAYGRYGKPYLAQCPDVHFNLSHSGTIALCAVAWEPVGADVELRHKHDEGIAELCFTGDERRWMCEQPDADIAFTRMWVRKESYLKLLGTGLTDDVKAFDVSPAAVGEKGVRFWEWEHRGHYASVCCRGEARVSFRVAPPLFWQT